MAPTDPHNHTTNGVAPTLRIAIIGGGPAGLGAAIALSSLSLSNPAVDVQLTIYEKAKVLREVGAGINIGYNGWRVLELLGAADGVRGHLQVDVYHRNGLNGEIINSRSSAESTLPLKYRSRRVRRTRLQSALLARVPEGVIQLNKELVSLEDVKGGGLRLVFKDGTETTADLVLGGDGIRSVVREAIFPAHSIKFTGTTIWRTLIPTSSVSHLPDLYPAIQWWHGPSGHSYFSLVDDPAEVPGSEQMFEIAARYVVDPETDKESRFSWGIPATKERVEKHFREYDHRVREAIAQVPEGNWKEFAAFAGPRLEKLIAWDKVVLLGDASHPLSGAFGSGAAFALEDGWILARALEYAHRKNDNGSLTTPKAAITEALSIFDEIRSPYYLRMYEYLDNHKRQVQEARSQAASQDPDPVSIFEKTVRTRIESFNVGDQLNWIYRNDIETCWEQHVQAREEEKTTATTTQTTTGK
ncbi:hypothetical protein MPDQ_004901 [Monascus purpureus]|uniref:FAD-binding domain-containing protein n=1 Tax=Monascus purpureus TaxID=5098 RepID=A0A507QX94_MONPU|nr:hypothetical protein MPDQ_004901 [Monascus purpureus]BDD55826.1 hypothetical protein MAP00_001310 [Monascus purpureus]